MEVLLSSVKINNKKLKQLEKALKAFDDITIKVGIQEDAGYGEDGKTRIVDYGYWNEYGTKTKDGKVHIPQRSFIRETARMHNNWKDEMQSAFNDVLYKNEDPKLALRLVGGKAADDIKARIANGISPANAESTVKRKNGKRTPLIEHGFLRKSIKYVMSKGE